MTDQSPAQRLMQAVQRYFDLIYESDVTQFERVFAPTAQLHGLHDGKLAMLSAATYKEAVAARPSVRRRGLPRCEEVLLVDFASPTQALVKVRVRWNTAVYVDYLTYHETDGDWRITSKGFHVESIDPAGRM